MANPMKKLYDQGKALMAPEDTEAQSFAEKQKNVDQYKDATAPALTIMMPKTSTATPAADKVGSGMYGSRPGEQRIDTSSMTKPLADETQHQEHLNEEKDLHPNMVSFHAKGGKLDDDSVNVVGEDGPEAIVGDEVIPMGHTEDRNPMMQMPEEKEGAPADFGGPVYDNPEHLKAKWDTEPADLPKTTVPMDASNPEKGQMLPGPMQTASARSNAMEIPKPVANGTQEDANKFVQSLPGTASPEARSKAVMAPPSGEMQQKEATRRAAQLAEPTPAPPEPNQIIADQHAKIMKDKLDAAAKGDFVGVGTAILQNNALKSASPQEEGTPAMGGAPGEVPAPNPAAMPEYTGKERIGAGTPGEAQAKKMYQDKLTDLDQKIIQASQKHTPEGKEELGYLQSEKAVLQKMNPKGSAANDPGVWGKIMHALGEVGNVAGNALIPNVMPAVPGSQANLAARNAAGQENVKEGIGEEKELAQAQMQKNLAARAGAGKSFEAQVYTDLTRPDATGKLPINQETGKPYTPEEAKLAAQRENNDERYIESQMQTVNPATGQLYNREESMAKLAQMKAQEKGQGQHTSDQERELQQYYKDHPEITRSFETDKDALNQLATAKNVGAPGITPEGNVVAVKPGASLPKGTQSFSEAGKQDNKWYTYLNDKGEVQYAQGKDIPQGADHTEVDPKTFMNEAQTANTVQQALNNLNRDVHEHPEIWDNAAARAILATTLDQVDRQSASMLVAGTGGNIPLPSGLGDMINTQLQNKALDKPTATALKDYISDYKSAKDQGIVMQMALQGGKIGRGSQQAFKAIIDQFPNGSTPDSREALRQMGLLQQKQNVIASKYPEKYQGFNKEKPWTPSGKSEGSAQSTPKQSFKEWKAAQQQQQP